MIPSCQYVCNYAPVRRIAVTSLTLALLLAVGCSSSKESEPPPPESAALQVIGTTVSGPGASAAEAAKSQSANELVAPIRNYFDKAYFKVEFPTTDFRAAFDGFTPTVATAALGGQAETMTPASISEQLGELHATTINVTVSMYAEDGGAVGLGTAKVAMVGEGRLSDKSPVAISQVADFYLVKSGQKWMVTGYVVSQKIDAPPPAASDSTATATPGAATTTTASATPSASPSPSRSASATRSPSPTRRR